MAFLNTMVNLLPDMHAVERDSWQACCSPRAAFPRSSPRLMLPLHPPPPPGHLSLSVHVTTTHVNDIDSVCLFIAITHVVRTVPFCSVLQHSRPSAEQFRPARAGPAQFHCFTVTGVAVREVTLLLRVGKEPGSHLDPQICHYKSGIFTGFLSYLCKILGYR